MNQFDDVA